MGRRLGSGSEASAGGDPPSPLHPRLLDAAGGRLPEWAVASHERREHIARVAALMDEWGRSLGLGPSEAARWRAAGWLHDSLRDADPEEIRGWLPPDLLDLPGPLVHGPAAAARLESDGVDDMALLDAVRWHTLGHPRLGRLGRALYLADFLDPGRRNTPGWRASLRERVPAELEEVLVDVLAARLRHLADGRRSIRPETLGFWNALVHRPTRP